MRSRPLQRATARGLRCQCSNGGSTKSGSNPQHGNLILSAWTEPPANQLAEVLRDPGHAASNRTAEVRGSNPLGSTNDFNELKPRSICRQISPEAYRKQENRTRSRSKIDPVSTLKIRHFESWRERARAAKLFRDSLCDLRLDRVIGLKQHIRFD